MHIERKEGKNVLLLVLQGRLDAGHCRTLEDELEEDLRRGAYHVTLDMGEVLFLSSAGIRTLLHYRKTLLALGGELSICQSSEFVREILAMVGMEALFCDPAKVSSVPSSETLKRYDLASSRGFQTELATTGKACPFGAGSWGLGVGSFERSSSAHGEILAMEGFALMLPPGDGQVPDFMARSGDFVPSVHFSSGLVMRGEPSCCLRFSEPLPGLPLSHLARSALEATGGNAVAMALVGETSGLVGASLNRLPGEAGSPVAKTAAEEDFFSLPGLRDHLAYWPEKRYDRHLAVVAGVAILGDPGQLAPQVRSLGDDDNLRGHFHGAVFPFKAIPQGPVELPSLLSKLFDALDPIGLLHLLHDRRPISGAGESTFLSGALWAGSLKTEKPSEGGNA
ncbi:STAS domain-containing protein [Aminirod propionatiphilus]|uniref:STAS domain-containing protein n=1 Tax=Aminirod propionatiphilus TaxID=3415223 RepID=A0ACD1DZ59_9BACT|nr:STAS domain-containing protein [Synergistota bacterium]